MIHLLITNLVVDYFLINIFITGVYYGFALKSESPKIIYWFALSMLLIGIPFNLYVLIKKLYELHRANTTK